MIDRYGQTIDWVAASSIGQGFQTENLINQPCAAVVYRFDDCILYIDAVPCAGSQNMYGAVCESKYLS